MTPRSSASGFERVEDAARTWRFAQHQPHSRVLRAKPSEHRRQEVSTSRRTAPDPDLAGFEPDDFAHRALAVLDRRKCSAGTGQERAALRRERRAAGTAREKTRADLVLELGDRRGERRLGDVAVPRGRRERSVLCDELRSSEGGRTSINTIKLNPN